MFNSSNSTLITNSYLAGATAPSYTPTIVDDFERLTGSTVGPLLTASRSFTGGDVNKIVVVKNARDYAAYRTAPLSWVGKIASVASGVATISTTLGHTLIDVTGQEVLIGTNNFDVLQAACDYCTANNIRVMNLNFTGTAFINPQLSAVAAAQTHTTAYYRGIRVTNKLTIKGLDPDTTILKWGCEDNVIVNANNSLLLPSEYVYGGFVYGISGTSLKLQNLQLAAPDRATTRTNSNVAAIMSAVQNNGEKDIELNNVKITGDRDLGWKIGMYSSRGGHSGYQVQNRFIDTEITANYPITVFSGDGAYQKLYVRDTTIVGGGAKEYRPVQAACANITNGGTTLTITGNDEFSFYDCNSYAADLDVNGTPVVLPLFLINGTYKGRVTSIVSPRVATVYPAASSTFTNANIQMFGRGRGAEGHTMYVHPNVDLDMDGFTVSDTAKLSLHYYSGGSVTGNVGMRTMKNLNFSSAKPAGYPTTLVSGLWEWVSAGLQMDGGNNDANIPYILEDSNVYLYENTNIPVYMDGNSIQGGQFGGGDVVSSTGILDDRGNADVLFDDVQGAYITTEVLNIGIGKTATIQNCGTTTKCSTTITSADTLIINTLKTGDLYFYNGCKGLGKSFTFTNVDIRNTGGFYNYGWAFAGTVWTTPEMVTFLSQSTFTNCTCSSVVYNNMGIYDAATYAGKRLKDNFTVT